MRDIVVLAVTAAFFALCVTTSAGATASSGPTPTSTSGRATSDGVDGAS